MARPLLETQDEIDALAEDLDVVPEQDRQTARDVAAIVPLVELGITAEAEIDVTTTPASEDALLVCRIGHGDWEERLQVTLTALADDYVRAHAGPDGRIDDFTARRRATALSRALTAAAARIDAAVVVPPICEV